jgi:hypothetical protein
LVVLIIVIGVYPSYFTSRMQDDLHDWITQYESKRTEITRRNPQGVELIAPPAPPEPAHAPAAPTPAAPNAPQPRPQAVGANAHPMGPLALLQPSAERTR